jgi:hypothetical protein
MPISNRRRVIAILKLPRKVPALLVFAALVVKAMKNSRNFPDPTPELEEVRQRIDELRVAQAATLDRTEGTVAVRDEKLAALVVLLWQLRSYVESTAHLHPRDARRIIRSAGLAVRKDPERPPPQFRARLGVDPGTVVLMAPAAAQRASYDWAYSVDYGSTWKPLPTTLQSRTSVSGLPRPAIVKFRYLAITKAGEGLWSEPIAIFVP